MFGKSLSEYVSFEKWILVFIVAVALGRLVLSLAGLPNASVKWLSVSVALLLGILAVGARAGTAGFAYKQLLPLVAIQSIVSQLIVIVAIVLAIQTGADNIYSAPEYSGNVDGKNWGHVLGHTIVGLVVAPLIGWLLASGAMFVAKKLSSSQARA
jgi:hypothetical protein